MPNLVAPSFTDEWAPSVERLIRRAAAIVLVEVPKLKAPQLRDASAIVAADTRRRMPLDITPARQRSNRDHDATVMALRHDPAPL